MTDDPFQRLQRQAQVRQDQQQSKQSDIDDVFERLAANREKTSIDVGEMDRILSLPIAPTLTEAQVEEISRRVIDGREFDRGFRLLPTQAAGIYAFDQMNGAFLTVGVGRGKAGISMICADIAFRVKNIERSLLLVPASVYKQTMLSVVPMWRRVANICVPMIGLGNKSKAARLGIARSGQRGCYVMPYSLLSRPDALEILGTIKPRLVIADEAHAFRNLRKSARAKKFVKYMSAMAKADQRVMMVAMSGTMTSKGIKDYHHLIDMCLQGASPLPRTGSLAYFWGQMLDTSAEIDDDTDTRSLQPLVKWAAGYYPKARNYDPWDLSDLREAYKLRLNSAPGVVSSGDREIGTSLTLVNQPVSMPSEYEGYQAMMTHLDTLERAWLTPDGDELDCAVHLFKWKSELSAGFYNSLYWPQPDELAKRKDCSLEHAAGALDMGVEWLGKHQEYAKGMREFLKWSPPGLDSPMEVARAINQGVDGIPIDLVNDYHDMMRVRERSVDLFGFFAERWSKVVRVCDYKIWHAVRWAREHGSGILWCHHKGMALWLNEVLQDEGLQPVYCPAGADETISEIGDPDRGGKGDRLCVASITAHCEGKNLQAFKNQHYVQWPRVARVAEQSLGRLHREGQKADELLVHTNHTLTFDHVNFAACVNDAVYAHQTLGSRQKVVICNYDPPPQMFTAEFLRAQGADPQTMTREMRELMEEKFGGQWKDRL